MGRWVLAGMYGKAGVGEGKNRLPIKKHDSRLVHFLNPGMDFAISFIACVNLPHSHGLCSNLFPQYPLNTCSMRNSACCTVHTGSSLCMCSETMM